MIQRYDWATWQSSDGEYVLYTDHAAALTEKDREIERLKETTIDVWIKVPKEDSDG